MGENGPMPEGSMRQNACRIIVNHLMQTCTPASHAIAQAPPHKWHRQGVGVGFESCPILFCSVYRQTNKRERVCVSQQHTTSRVIVLTSTQAPNLISEIWFLVVLLTGCFSRLSLGKLYLLVHVCQQGLLLNNCKIHHPLLVLFASKTSLCLFAALS